MFVEYSDYGITDDRLIELLDIYYLQMLRMNTLELGIDDNELDQTTRDNFYTAVKDLRETYTRVLLINDVSPKDTEKLIRVMDNVVLH